MVTVVLNDLIFLLVSNTYFPAILTQNIKMTSIPPSSLRRGKRETENYMELTITKITARYFLMIAVFSIILSFFFVDKLPRLKSWIAMLLHQKRLIFSQQVQWQNAESFMGAIVVLKNVPLLEKAFSLVVCLAIYHCVCSQGSQTTG